MDDLDIELLDKDVPLLFKEYFYPTLLGMLSLSVVTMADGIFIGHGIGADGVAAVNLVWAPLMLLLGLGLMLGMGCSVSASVSLAEHNQCLARQHVTQSMVFGVAIVLLVMLLMLYDPHVTVRYLGASDTLVQITVDYLIFLLPGFLFNIICNIGLFALRCAGNPQVAMWATLLPALVNILLDWLFIFPFQMGIKGAALATSLSYVSGALVVLMGLSRTHCRLRLTNVLKKNAWHKFSGHIWRQCKIGVSALLAELVMALTMFLGNSITIRLLGDAGVSAFGIICYYLPFVFLVGNAIAQASQPIISFNYGSKHLPRVREAVWCGIKTALWVGGIVAASFYFLHDILTSLFLPTDSPAGLIAKSAFPYYAVCVFPYIINIVIIGYFQSVENVPSSIVFSLLRGPVFLIPAFFLLPDLLGQRGIWLALAASEMTVTLLIIVYYKFKISISTWPKGVNKFY